MDAWRLLPRCALAGLVLFAGADAGRPRVFAALEEFDRLSSREMWPGFEPAGIPVEDAQALGLRRLESVALERALPAGDGPAGAAKISEKGLTLEFRGARVSRSDHTVTITLR